MILVKEEKISCMLAESEPQTLSSHRVVLYFIVVPGTHKWL